MNKLQVKRLLNVAKALRQGYAAHPLDFGMGNYANECGTPACALGHYAHRRDLQRTFQLDYLESEHGTDGRKQVVNNGGWGIHYDSTPICKHFGINAREATELFASEGCGGAQDGYDAAKYIERFVEDQD